MFAFFLCFDKKNVENQIANLQEKITMKQNELISIQQQMDSARLYDQNLKNRINYIQNSNKPYKQPVDDNKILQPINPALFDSNIKHSFFKTSHFYNPKIEFASSTAGQFSSIKFGRSIGLNCYPESFSVAAILNSNDRIEFPAYSRKGELYPDINLPFPIQFSKIEISVKSGCNNTYCCFPSITAIGRK